MEFLGSLGVHPQGCNPRRQFWDRRVRWGQGLNPLTADAWEGCEGKAAEVWMGLLMPLLLLLLLFGSFSQEERWLVAQSRIWGVKVVVGKVFFFFFVREIEGAYWVLTGCKEKGGRVLLLQCCCKPAPNSTLATPRPKTTKGTLSSRVRRCPRRYQSGNREVTVRYVTNATVRESQ